MRKERKACDGKVGGAGVINTRNVNGVGETGESQGVTFMQYLTRDRPVWGDSTAERGMHATCYNYRTSCTLWYLLVVLVVPVVHWLGWTWAGLL